MNAAVTETQMLIRKPVAEVFNALIDPAITTNFWFTKSSGMLSPGAEVKWDWEMYNVSTNVSVKEIVPNKKILIQWGDQKKRDVEFQFKAFSDNTTYVVIKESGYIETGVELLASIKDSTGGFTTVLDGMKAYLEHGINLHLIRDKFPKQNSKD